MKKETKQLISIGFGYLATFLFVQDKLFTYIIALCIFVGLVFIILEKEFNSMDGSEL